MSKIVFITGASSGFGEATARLLAKEGCQLIISGRRKEKLEALAAELGRERIHVLAFDVRNREEVLQAISTLPEHLQQIDVLVNNAGLALGRDNFELASLDDWDTMVDTNVKGFAYVAHAVANLMVQNKKGHIINIGSISGKEVYAQGNMYCATKHAVAALSQGMRVDLLPYGIRVTAIHPGAAVTEFSDVRFKGNQETAAKVYEGIAPLVGADIADIVWYCMNTPAHVCINEINVTCTQQANSFYVHRK